MSRKYAIPRNYIQVGDYLQRARMAKGLTQRNVADSLGYSSAQFVSNFERGIALPPIKKLKIMIKLYGVSSNEILELILNAERQILEAGLGVKSSARSRTINLKI